MTPNPKPIPELTPVQADGLAKVAERIPCDDVAALGELVALNLIYWSAKTNAFRITALGIRAIEHALGATP